MYALNVAGLHSLQPHSESMPRLLGGPFSSSEADPRPAIGSHFLLLEIARNAN